MSHQGYNHEVQRLQVTKQAELVCRTLLSSLAYNTTSTDDMYHGHSRFRLFLTSVMTVIWKQDFKERIQLKGHCMEVNTNLKLTAKKAQMVSINCISCSLCHPCLAQISTELFKDV